MYRFFNTDYKDFTDFTDYADSKFLFLNASVDFLFVFSAIILGYFVVNTD